MVAVGHNNLLALGREMCLLDLQNMNPDIAPYIRQERIVAVRNHGRQHGERSIAKRAAGSLRVLAAAGRLLAKGLRPIGGPRMFQGDEARIPIVLPIGERTSGW